MTIYNENINWINKSIKSIQNQTFNDFEAIIIVDNPQYTEAIKYLKDLSVRDSRFVIYVNSQNIGLASSLNRALKYCNGKYIARMDADDIALLNRFENQINFLDMHEEIHLIGGQVVAIDEEDNELYRTTCYGDNSKRARESLKIRNVFWHPTWMFRNIVLNKLNGYNNVPYAEDYDFLCRLILCGYNICNIDETLCYYRIRNNGITNENIRKQKDIAKIISKNYKRSEKYNKEYEVIENLNQINIEKSASGSLLYKKAILYLKNNNRIKGIILLILSIIVDINILKEFLDIFKLRYINKKEYKYEI